MRKYLLAIDQGTTSSRALLFDREGTVIGSGQHRFEQLFPRSGWVSHRLSDIWESVVKSVRDAVHKAKISPESIAAIGITNQRETSGIWNKKTGEPLSDAIVWQCRRTTDRCRELKERGLEEKIREKTGLLLDPYFSATKFEWLLKQINLPSDQIALGTIDSFLAYMLSGKQVHVTDVSNASRTLLFNLETTSWDEELLPLFGIQEEFLPQIASSSEVVGHTLGLDFLPDGIPIAGMIGDQQAALFGQCCFKPYDAKCTFGTGAFVLINTGHEIVCSKNNLLTTIAWKLKGEKVVYALEGSAFVAGSAIEWLKDGLGIIQDAKEMDELASKIEDSEEVVFIPALCGLGAPYWKAEARGMIRGITGGTTRAHIARAVLEGIGLEVDALVEAMEEDLGHAIAVLRVDGGVSRSNVLLQELSNLLECRVIRSKSIEATAQGAAFMAGLAVGFWKNKEELETIWETDHIFEMMGNLEQIAHLKLKWRAAIDSL